MNFLKITNWIKLIVDLAQKIKSGRDSGTLNKKPEVKF